MMRARELDDLEDAIDDLLIRRKSGRYIATTLANLGYRKPRVVTDREGLRDLPDGSVLMSDGRYKMYSGAIWRIHQGLVTRVGKELDGVTPIGFFVDPLPVTVLYEPEAS